MKLVVQPDAGVRGKPVGHERADPLSRKDEDVSQRVVHLYGLNYTSLDRGIVT
jgi:hypothetical protein